MRNDDKEGLHSSPHIMRCVRETPWAMLPSTLDTLVELIQLRSRGEPLTQDEITARIGVRKIPATQAAAIQGDVAVIPLWGIIVQRMNILLALIGGTSTEKFGALVQRLVDAPEVGAIVMDVDSPGGSVYGVEEVANIVYAARGRKPIIAVANPLAASAAYWIASQADEVVVTPSGEAGGIGVIAVHEDLSRKAEMEGITITFIVAGKWKAEGNRFAPLTDEAREFLQKRVNEYYRPFVRAVARGRGVSQTAVREDFGGGRVLGAQDLLRLGMVDRIATLSETVARFQRPGAVAAMRAMARRRELAARERALEDLEPEAYMRWRRLRLIETEGRAPSLPSAASPGPARNT